MNGDVMAWTLEGTYFENCSCDTICPCTWSGLTAPATHDRCQAMLAFHIDRGDIEGVDVGGLTFAMVVDSPPVMSDGGWKLGVVMDGAADRGTGGRARAGARRRARGSPAMLGPLIGEMLGIEQAPAEWRQSDGTFTVRFGDLIDVEVKTYMSGALAEPVQLVNVFHPANTTLTVSPATKSKVDVFGITLRRHRHQRLQRAVRLVGVTAPAAPVERPALRLTPTIVMLGARRRWHGPASSRTPATWATASAPWACRSASSCRCGR